MLAEALVVVVLPLILAAAAGWDLASFTIPNFLQGLLIICFVAFAAATHLGAPDIGLHLLAGALGLAVGFTLFAFGYIGGGDAKLFATVVLWLGLKDLMPYTLVATVLGGVLTLTLLGLRRLPLPAFFARQAWIIRLHDSDAGVPYGVALAAGVFVVLPGTEIFHLAAAV
jgi:prepilin peptidase CpaA